MSEVEVVALDEYIPKNVKGTRRALMKRFVLPVTILLSVLIYFVVSRKNGQSSNLGEDAVSSPPGNQGIRKNFTTINPEAGKNTTTGNPEVEKNHTIVPDVEKNYTTGNDGNSAEDQGNKKNTTTPEHESEQDFPPPDTYVLPTNYFIGSQSIFGNAWSSYRISPFAEHGYDEEGYDMLTEFREGVALTGMNQFKFKLSSTTCQSYSLSCASDEIASLKELSQVPEVAKTLKDSRFNWYHIWVYSLNLPSPFQTEFTAEVMEAEYQEMYDWAVYMLKTYNNTNKVFFVGAWEGDWTIMSSSGCMTSSGYNSTCVPSDTVIDRYIKWSSIRQDAINDAKEDHYTEGVDIFHYIEFNLADENYEDHPSIPGEPRPTILNSVVPAVNPDFLSFSSYKSTNAYSNYAEESFDQDATDSAFWDMLDYAEGKLRETSTDFSVLGDLTKRVFIGEFGALRDRDPATHAGAARHVFRAALEWGCPFVLQWESYDNDSNTQPLISRDASDIYTLSTLRQLYKDWHDAANEYIVDMNPSADNLRTWAVEWFS